MALVLKQPIARLHKKEQHVRIKPLHTKKRKAKVSKRIVKNTANKTNKRKMRAGKQLKLFVR